MTPSDDSIVLLLRLVQTGDDSNDLVDNGVIGSRLGWAPEQVAAVLAEAKERSLVWGVRGGQKPAPWFSELEVTVQGRRFLEHHQAFENDSGRSVQ